MAAASRDQDRAPSGPRGAVGALAEDAAVRYLRAQGWTILGRNVRVGPNELDIVALEPGSPPTLVVVEVRSRSGPGFGAAHESVDRAKVARLYRAAYALSREGWLRSGPSRAGSPRVDLLGLRRLPAGSWALVVHLRGLEDP